MRAICRGSKMQLEMAEFPVREIRLGKAFRYDDGILEVDRQALIALLLQDSNIRAASLAVAVLGEKVRVTGVRDIVEPRVKVSGDGQVFPGTLSAVVPVGRGRTHRLSGMAVVAAVEYEGMIRSGSGAECWAILDMWGPGAEASRFSKLVNLVLILRLVKGLTEFEAHTAIQQAEYRTAKLLAETTLAQRAEKEERYDLADGNSSLPKVLLIQGCHT